MKNYDENFDLKKRLVDKSFEAYILALETINRITIQYRLETFCYLICNAWELLLKAKILDNKEDERESIYYSKEEGKPRRTLSLRDCLYRVLPNQKDPTRRNIERIAELRDESVHLVISQIPRDVIGLFQAGVINYHSCLKEWFGVSLSDRVPVGMMSIVYDMGPEQLDMTDRRLRKQLGQEAATFLTGYCAEIRQELDQLQHSVQFSIGIEYSLVLTKKHNDADIVLSSGSGYSEPTQIVTVPKDPSASHPLRQKEVIEHLKMEGLSSVNSYDIQCVNKVYNVKSKSEYFYQGKVTGSPGQYSQTFIQWLIGKHRRDDQFFHKTRTKARGKKKT